MEFMDILAISALVFGFGFVIFFHELGHFLAAKWVDIKVEQFAVGFGQAIVSWRKGMGLMWGSSGRKIAELEKRGADLSKYGETEYRLNWVPLGGYVKMLGQDDLNPNAQAEDPRSYNKKSIAARMIVVSAGVIMNIILAALLFIVVFLMGFNVSPPVVGSMSVNSPAQLAGLQVGDRIVMLDDTRQYDVKNILLTTALADPGTEIPVKIERNGKEMDLKILPRRDAEGDFLMLGVAGISDLRGQDAKLKKKYEEELKENGIAVDPATQIMPGDVIEAVNEEPVASGNYAVLFKALQESRGQPVPLKVRDADGNQRTVNARVGFQSFFGGTPVNFAGLEPRPRIKTVNSESPVKDKLLPDDVIVSLNVNGKPIDNPGITEFVKHVSGAGKEGWKVDFIVDRAGQRHKIENIVPNLRVGPGKKGVGVGLDLDEQTPIVSSVIDGSAAARAKVPSGSRILKIDGQDVKTWFDVHRLLRDGNGASAVTYQLLTSDGKPEGDPRQVTMQLDESEQKTLANVRYSHELALGERIQPRKTKNPLVATVWGITETRDLLLQFYLTLQRLVQGSVGVSNFMGPIGIVHAGSLFALKGNDWLIWFLAMISANLAVVNFLPIPIVDGGLFTFLIVEKIQGKPLSARMQTVAQLVGLAIILSVFLLVTYQDIARLWM